MNAEISFDLVMEDGMSFVEGTFRLPEAPWQVFVFSTFDGLQEAEVNRGQWESGVTGLFVRFPKSTKLNKEAVQKTLSQALGVTLRKEVHGPDSMELR